MALNINPLGFISDIFGKVMDKISPDKSETRQAQAAINEKEIGGAPQSWLRLWRSFLGWVLSLVFIWEVIARTIILTYWPDINVPPSMLQEIMVLLLGMLGLGF